jgi:hypothetical protein
MSKWLNSAGDKGKSISMMKLGEQMAFFKEKCGLFSVPIRDEELAPKRVQKMYLTQLLSPFWFLLVNISIVTYEYIHCCCNSINLFELRSTYGHL